jgi:predicted Zn finger-like uncharacterized protein
MIIQCRQCRTKFRFDDAKMEEEGVWLRCSNCRHVFFQDNVPGALPDRELPANGEKTPSADGSSMPRMGVLPKDVPISGGDDDAAQFLENVLQAKKDLNDEVLLRDIEKPDEEEDDIDGVSRTEEDQDKKGKAPQRRGKILKIFLWVILVIVVVPAIIYFFVFPQVGDRLLRVVNKYVDIGIREPARPEVVVGLVKLQDIRQRILNNYILGQIRVVEGTAVNQADYAISRIVIKGEIVDAYAVVLGERASYAGNVLTEEELTTLPEEEILRKLSQPEGRSNSNDKIIPNGQIPFMIIFTREPAGVIKTTVMTIGAERLLEK